MDVDNHPEGLMLRTPSATVAVPLPTTQPEGRPRPLGPRPTPGLAQASRTVASPAGVLPRPRQQRRQGTRDHHAAQPTQAAWCSVAYFDQLPFIGRDLVWVSGAACRDH